MENRIENDMEDELETRGISGFMGLNLSYHTGQTIFFTIDTHYGNLI